MNILLCTKIVQENFFSSWIPEIEILVCKYQKILQKYGKIITDTYHMVYVFFSEPFLNSAVPMVLDCIVGSEIKIDHFNNEWI